MNAETQASKAGRPSVVDDMANYSYVANVDTVQWLYILYNDDIVLRYRLKVKQPEPAGVVLNE